jgi:hypothetical protein
MSLHRLASAVASHPKVEATRSNYSEVCLTADEHQRFLVANCGPQLQIVRAVTRRLPSPCGESGAGTVLRRCCAAAAPP